MSLGKEEKPYITSIAIAVAGSVDSGKSSFIGVLISNELDDGNGLARSLVANHPHEIETGRTSSISTKICKFETQNGKKSAITFIDLCGHEKYFKSTSFGITGYFPDYAFVIVSANRGILPMTKQHLRLLISFNIPFMFIITHIDLAPPEIYQMTCDSITKVCKSYIGKLANTKFINTYKDYEIFIDQEHKEEISNIEKPEKISNILDNLCNTIDGRQLVYPVLTISNTNGFYIDVMKSLIAQIPQRAFWNTTADTNVLNNKVIKHFKLHINPTILPAHQKFDGTIFYIDSGYNPPGIGIVSTGIARGKSINTGDIMWLGPFGKEFIEVRIKSMHNNARQLVNTLEDHNRGCIAFAPKKNDITKDKLNKGMIMISPYSLIKNICFHFKACIMVYNNSVTMKSNYSPVIHMNNIKQSARMIIEGTEKVLSTGNVETVIFKFKSKPEYIEPYNIFVFTSGDVHGCGMIIEPISLEIDPDGKPDPIKLKRFSKRKEKRMEIVKERLLKFN